MYKFLLQLSVCACLSGCVSYAITGANLVYDRHSLYKKWDDVQLAGAMNKAIFSDNTLKKSDCSIDIAVFNGDVLLAGYVPNEALRNSLKERAESVKEYRRLFFQIGLKPPQVSGLEDSWITTKIRTQILADSDINPGKFKVVTVDGIVYLMGDVRPKQAQWVIEIAKNTAGVKRVVKLFRYYHLSDTE